ncbi:MAG: response regulator [Deltaproteobacteria bacterium]|nr:response regulator [Deltaproteobacteria bacterium]
MNPISSEAIIASIADHLSVGIWVARAPGGELVYSNRVFDEIMGMSARDDVTVGGYAEPYGIRDLSGAKYPEERLPFVQALQTRRTVVVDDIVIHRRNGTRVNIRAEAKPIFDEVGVITHVVICFSDVTTELVARRAQVETEKRLLAAQRLEWIGTLTAGIAHDFNNLLAGVRMVAARVRMKKPEPLVDEAFLQIDEIVSSSERLTRALLGFGRRGQNLDQSVELARVVRTVAEIVQRTGVTNLMIVREQSDEPCNVKGDYSQIEQVVMNLVLNARDAMPEGGEITLRTRPVVVVDPEGDPPLTPGRYVLLEVADQGPGIPVDRRAQVFEPYFTTKAENAREGAGLGLATVQSIVHGHHGAIVIADNAPRGAVFRVWLPASEHRPDTAAPGRGEANGEVVGGSGVILIVEDNPHVRRATGRLVEALGYEVILAASGEEAVEIFRTRNGVIDAVLLDMTMPKLGGGATYGALRAIDPGVAVCVTTGFARNDDVQALLDAGVLEFLPKPYSAIALASTVRRLVSTSHGSLARRRR